MTIKKTVLLTLALTIALLLGLLALPAHAEQIIKKDEKIITKKDIKKDRLGSYLDKLASLECKNCADNYKRMDSNHKFSYGCLQFQRDTFVYFSKKFNLQGKIESCADQKNLARYMFLADTTGASYQWYTTIYKRGLGLPIL